MRVANWDDQDVVVDIISQSFDENKSINFVAKQDKKRKERIQLLIRYSFFQGMNFGKVYLSDDNKGACIVLFPNQKKTTFGSVIWDLKLAFKCIGASRVLKVLKRESGIKAKQPTDKNFVHLWYIGVYPDSQQKGIGSSLLSNILKKYPDEMFYLETSTAENLPFYKKYNFKVTDTIDLGYALHILKKPKDV